MSVIQRPQKTGQGDTGKVKNPSQRSRRFQPGGMWWPFALPAIVFVGLFFVLPFLLNFRLAFTNWSTYSSKIDWNGLYNFEILQRQGILLEAISITVAYAIVAMMVQNVVSLLLALALEQTNFINSVFRSIFFIPVLISSVAAGFIWYAMLSPNGPINQIIAIFVPGFSHAWFGDARTALLAVAFTDAWKWSGIATLVYIAGLNAIPKELLEAATIDGASVWQRLTSIRLPLLAPAFTFTIVTTLLGAISAYDIPAATTRGGPGTATRVLNLAMQQQWTGGYFGTGSALSLVITLIVIFTAVPLVTYLRRREVSMQ
ncbi:MAG: sugar ABC transporter permease [Anaerolineaceae bacterium]|nr:sugar ABC transporter permease [Anaerolineaceae bacterium]